jgi:hypothetical protein
MKSQPYRKNFVSPRTPRQKARKRSPRTAYASLTVRELRELKHQLREERDKSKIIDEQRKTAERDAPEAYEVGANGGIG